MNLTNLNNWRGAASAIASALSMLRPPNDLRPSEWAERNIKIPEGNKLPGQYRISNAPIQREPMDQFIEPHCRRITLMWGAQLGKTMCALGMQGYAIAQRPQSQIIMQPSQGDLKTWLQTKFNPLCEASDAINHVISKPRSREGVNNQEMKSYPGGFIMFSWAGSTKTMRGRSAPKVFCDEVDGYDTTHEGHPVSLLWQRASTFGDDRSLIEISTPTLKDASYIEQAFLSGDQRYFYIRCYECGEPQTLIWGGVTWKGRRSTELHDAEKDLEEENHQPHTAMYTCEHCGCLWNDGHRLKALREAEEQGAGWKASRPYHGHASYHAWEAYSTFRRLEDIVQDYLERLKMGDLQSFANVSLARTYELKGDGCDPNSLYACRHAFPKYLPDEVQCITLGADMQMDRLEYEIVGWGANEESWSLGYGVLWGDPLEGRVFSELEDIIKNQKFTFLNGDERRISASALDTGGTTGYPQAAWEFLKDKTSRRIFGIKGYSPSWGNPIVTGPQRKRSGRSRRRVNIFPIAVDEAKVVIYRRINQTINATHQGGPGYIHVPEQRSEEWFQQITSEKLITRKGAYYKREWVLPSKMRNEALDCRVYAYAALKIINPRFSDFTTSSVITEDDDRDVSGNSVESKPQKTDTLRVKTRSRRVWKMM